MPSDHNGNDIAGLTDSAGISADGILASEELRLELLRTQAALQELQAAVSHTEGPDYTLTLATHSQTLQELKATLRQITAHPALSITPAAYQRAMTEVSQGILRNALTALEDNRQASERTRQNLMSTVGTLHSRRRQLSQQAAIATAALVIGLCLSPLLARLLPIEFRTRVAAAVMATDRWNAGGLVMEAGDPERWQTLIKADTLWRTNRDAIRKCAGQATQKARTQRCDVIVTP